MNLIIRSNHVKDSNTCVDIIKMISDTCGEYTIRDVVDCGYEFIEFVIPYSDDQHLKEMLNKITDNVQYPDGTYDNVSSDSIDIKIESDLIDPNLTLVIDHKLDIIKQQLHSLETFINVEVEETNKLEERVEAINSFIVKSGLVHYEQTMKHLLNELDKKGIIDGSRISSIIFTPHH